MGSVISKLGKAAAGYLSIKALINFGKQCTQLGSDLSEVQNVVDVTFPHLNDRVNRFAKNALDAFGLSETSAKQYMGTMGAMLKSMGLSESAAESMSEKITGLSADMASFYNLDAEDAFAKIRSGISGETEPLKQLGINMSVANLEAYRMAQGIDTAYSSMSQQEQALLRYNYLLSVTKDAQGDFARTSDSWANQTRILSERFNQLKASIGQSLIVVLTPVVKVINSILVKLIDLSNVFATFISNITGKAQKTISGVSSATDSALSGVVDTASSSAAGAEKIADSAQKTADKAAKTAKKTVMAFDELNIMQDNSTDSSSSSGGSGSGADIGGIETGMTEASTAMDDANKKLSKMGEIIQGIVNRAKELAGYFKSGFKEGLGDVNLEPLQRSIESIGKSVKEIFSDEGVQKAANGWANTFAEVLGQFAGSVTSIGISIATNLVGGLSIYLEEHTESIKQYLINMFNIHSDTISMMGNLATSIAEIFSVFGEETGQQVTADIIGIFSGAYMGITEILAKIGRDFIQLFVTPIIDNTDKINDCIEEVLECADIYFGSIEECVEHLGKHANEVYDNDIKPFFDDLASGFSDIQKAALEAYEKYFLPVLRNLSQKFSETVGEHIEPMLKQAMTLIGQVAKLVDAIWKNVLQPVLSWAATKIYQCLSPVFEFIGSSVLEIINDFSDLATWVMKKLGEITDFLTRIFSGDFKGAMNMILKSVEGVANGAVRGINKVIGSLNSLSFTVPDWVPHFGGNHFGFNIPTVREIQIPRLATGGQVDSGQLFLAREKGPELVGEMGGKTTVANNNQIIEGIKAGVIDAMMEVFMVTNANGSQDNGGDIVLMIDSEEIARAAIKGRKTLGFRYGVAFD